jgi:uncharacterized protein (TIGR04255 family)
VEATPDYNRDLVTFANPPVAEVALSIQFAKPLTDDARTLGDFWPLIRTAFPRLQQQPAMPRMSEDFGPLQPPQIQFLAQAPPTRIWFLNDDESRLLQVQPDRFTANWRRTAAETPYPRYRELRQEYEQLLSAFVEAVHPEEEVVPDWCEVTYVNHILGEPGGTAPELSEITNLVRDPADTSVLPELEDVQLIERFLIRAEDEPREPTGRLHIAAAPAIRTLDQVPLQQLTLTARGKASDSDIASGLAFLDRGRNLIVRGFREITTPAMHERWGLQE